MKKGLKILIPVLVLALIVSAFCIGALAADSNEAKIGETEYATLGAAINAVNNGEAEGNTVTLLKDIEGDLAFSIVKTVTVDLNGHSLSSTYTDKSKPIFAVNESNVGFTLTGEGAVSSTARFAQISSNSGAITGSTLDIKGTGKGITVTTTGTGATLLYLSGGGEIENTSFICAGAVSDGKSGHIQIYSDKVSFTNCNIYSTAAGKNVFYFAGIGAAAYFDGCYVTGEKFIFSGSYTSGIKNADDFKVVEAKNSVFIASDGTAKTNTAVLNACPNSSVQFSGVFDFTNCECAAYRVFETGCASNQADPAGSFAEGYNLTINVRDSVIRSLVHHNAPQIVRGFISFNAENCFFNISTGFSAASATAASNWSDASKINLKNCYFNKDISTDAAFTLETVGMLNRGYSWLLSAEHPDYPYYVCLTADAPTSGIPAKVLIQNGQTKSYVTSTGDNPLLGIVGATKYKADVNYGGEINMKLGRFDTVMDSDDSYFRFTYVLEDGTIPATPQNYTIPSGSDAYFVLGDDNKPDTFSFADYDVFVTDVDVKTNNFATNQINIIPQSRTTGGTATTANKNFRIIDGKIGGLTASSDAWHHIQMIIYVQRSEVAASDDNVAYVDYGSTYFEVYVDGAQVRLGDGTDAAKAVVNNALTLTTDETTGAITGQNVPYYQGMRFSVVRTGNSNAGCTSGAELCLDNLVIRAYESASDFTKSKLNTTALYKASGYSPDRSQAIYKGVKYTNASTVSPDGTAINILSTDASVKATENMSVIAPAGFTTANIINSILTGYADEANGLFYGKNTIWKTDIAETSALKAGTTLDLYATDGSHTLYYSHSELSALAALDSSGIPYAGADTEQEYGQLASGLLNGHTARMQGNITLAEKYLEITSSTQKEISFDLNGYTLAKTHKSSVFSQLKNTTFNLYSSRPGGTITSRGVGYSSVTSGATVFYANDTGSVVNIGAYGDHSGDNLTVHAAIFYDASSNATGAVCNVNGGTYVRYVADSRALFSTRAADTVITLNGASLLATYTGTTPLLNVENGSKGTINADGCTFYANLKDSAPTPLVHDMSYQGTVRLTNCSFTNIAFTHHRDETTDGQTSGKITLGAGNTYSELCDVTGAALEDGVSSYSLKDGWKQTLAGGRTQLTVILVEDVNTESTAYLVTDGYTDGIPTDATVFTLADQKFVTLAQGQALATFVLGNATVTEARDVADVSIPEGFELPSSKAGVYVYAYNPTAETVSGVSYITYTAELSIDFSLRSSISLEDSFVYNVFIPKALVDSGDIEAEILVGGKKVTLDATVTDGADEYYAVYITGITALMGGDDYEVNLTVNLGEDALTETASPVYTYSIPAYAGKLLDEAGEESAKAMLANVLNYVKCAMDWAGAPYTEADGYTAVVSALADYQTAGITPTDTSATDFAALSKRPDTLDVIDAVTAATFRLDSTVAVRFYLAESFTGTLTLTYKDVNNTAVNTAFTVENGKVDGKSYVELSLKAYYVANDITISFTGQSANADTAFNLAAYIVGCTDAEATTVAKALYAYATSALAYQNQK